MPSVTAAAHPQLATSFTWGQQQQQQQRQQQQQQRQQQQQHPQQKEREPPPAGADFKPTTQKKNKKPQPKQVPGQPPQQQAPIASPGSHGAAMMAPRKGLKMSPPSSESLTPSVSKLSLTRRNWHNNPEMHLWSAAPAKSKGGPRMTDQGKGGEGGGSMRLPQQSPLRRAEWWRRPPSPLAAHMRPLWDSGSAISSGSGDFPAAMKSMASGEGEAAAGGDTRRGGSQVRTTGNRVGWHYLKTGKCSAWPGLELAIGYHLAFDAWLAAATTLLYFLFFGSYFCLSNRTESQCVCVLPFCFRVI